MTGLINLDFADVKAVMQNAGTALMAIGEGHGEERAVQAARAAIASPLLDVLIDGAQGVLLNVSGGPDLTLAEVSEAAETVAAAADPNANIIFGAVVQPRVQDQVRITVIATGLKDAERLSSHGGGSRLARSTPRLTLPAQQPRAEPVPHRMPEPEPAFSREREAPRTGGESPALEREFPGRSAPDTWERRRDSGRPEASGPGASSPDDDWDTPSYLRRGR
jgi:cell division protein FtsZ